MRETLNLQALKHSKNPKHNKIYEKAHRMMEKGFETKDLSESEIYEVAKRFPQLDVRVMIGGNVIVKSKKDTWVIIDEVRFLTLYHRGIIISKGKVKEKYHVQDVFYDLEFILASIISHDDYALGIRSRTTEEIQELVENSR